MDFSGGSNYGRSFNSSLFYFSLIGYTRLEDNGLSPQLVLNDLSTRFIGHKIVYYPSLDSTMEAAKREAIWDAKAGTVIIADEQNAGRGRLNRTWVSPKGGLAFSIILRPNLEYLPFMVMIASLAVVSGIQWITGLNPQIKWPNDVLIGEKKVCGILIENDIRKNSLRHTVIGIGINVNLHMTDYPLIARFATSLSDQLGKEVSRLQVVREVLKEMDDLYYLLPDTETIQARWKSRLGTLGQKVQVNLGDAVCSGLAESVTKEGNLMLRQRDGSLIKIVAGDVNLKY
jgi:BirA family transcriptional regulator, biotin operon repressor / biotin---[acetyl-CoA-carboxylase] ligase